MIDEKLLSKRIPGLDPSKIMGARLCNQLQKHALEEYPKECIGYVKNGKYHRLVNQSKTPEISVAVSDEDILLLDSIVPEVICHSHPDGPDCPSGDDMVYQRQTDVPHAIVSTNGQGCYAPFVYGDMVAREPLLGRGFRYAVQDCYSLIRDYYIATRKIVLKDFPRDWEWWDRSSCKGNGMYVDHFRDAGFEEVSLSTVEEGDVLLIKAGAHVPNHGGIYLGDSLMLHHLAGRLPADSSRLSSIEPVVRWQQNGRIDKVLRYTGT